MVTADHVQPAGAGDKPLCQLPCLLGAGALACIEPRQAADPVVGSVTHVGAPDALLLGQIRVLSQGCKIRAIVVHMGVAEVNDPDRAWQIDFDVDEFAGLFVFLALAELLDPELDQFLDIKVAFRQGDYCEL